MLKDPAECKRRDPETGANRAEGFRRKPNSHRRGHPGGERTPHAGRPSFFHVQGEVILLFLFSPYSFSIYLSVCLSLSFSLSSFSIYLSLSLSLSLPSFSLLSLFYISYYSLSLLLSFLCVLFPVLIDFCFSLFTCAELGTTLPLEVLLRFDLRPL